jgi:RsiW-degrading membrane proteinase PrsW (M82 family)
MLIHTLLYHRDIKGLEELSTDPNYSEEWSLHAETFLATHKHHWFRASLSIGKQIFTEFDASVAGLVLLSGSIWFLIWLQAIQAMEAPFARITLCAASFALGVLSVIPTLLLVYWSENDLGLTEGQGLWGDIVFFLGGVGPREELCKLLAVLPLMPFLLKRGKRIEALVVAGFAGLGFAVEENFQYLSQHVAGAYGRFLTANFFHVAATALIGLGLFESLTEPRKKWWVFPYVFLWVSFIHGTYDLFLSSEELSSLKGLSMASFIWIGLVFFKRLRAARSLETNYFWIAASVILGVATVSAATLVYTSEAVGLANAVGALAAQAFSLGMLIYFFVWQTGNLRYDADL